MGRAHTAPVPRLSHPYPHTHVLPTGHTEWLSTCRPREELRGWGWGKMGGCGRRPCSAQAPPVWTPGRPRNPGWRSPRRSPPWLAFPPLPHLLAKQSPHQRPRLRAPHEQAQWAPGVQSRTATPNVCFKHGLQAKNKVSSFSRSPAPYDHRAPVEDLASRQKPPAGRVAGRGTGQEAQPPDGLQPRPTPMPDPRLPDRAPGWRAAQTL